MKKIFVITTIILLLISCNNREKVTIKGTYPEGSGKSLVLEILNVSQVEIIDSVKVMKNGGFHFKADLENPELMIIRNENDQIINLLPFPGENITIDIPSEDFKNGYTIGGSAESQKVKILVDQVEITKTRMDSLAKIIEVTGDTVVAKELLSKYAGIFDDQRMFNIRFIVDNLSSLASVYALYQRIGPEDYVLNKMNDLQFLKIVADSVKVKYPSSTLVTSLVNDVIQREEQYKNLLLINKLSDQAVNSSGMIDLTIPDADGNEVSISSLKGKVVLVSFWGSFDQTSRESNNVLKAIYDQYHSKGFEVYSVSLDNKRSDWLDAIRFEEYSWIDVCELSYPDSYAASIYNIQSLPTNYLIDKEGNIVVKNIYGRVLATWLDNLL